MDFEAIFFLEKKGVRHELNMTQFCKCPYGRMAFTGICVRGRGRGGIYVSTVDEEGVLINGGQQFCNFFCGGIKNC